MQICDQLNLNISEENTALEQHTNPIVWNQPDQITIHNQYNS